MFKTIFNYIVNIVNSNSVYLIYWFSVNKKKLKNLVFVFFCLIVVCQFLTKLFLYLKDVWNNNLLINSLIYTFEIHRNSNNYFCTSCCNWIFTLQLKLSTIIETSFKRRNLSLNAYCQSLFLYSFVYDLLFLHINKKVFNKLRHTYVLYQGFILLCCTIL